MRKAIFFLFMSVFVGTWFHFTPKDKDLLWTPFPMLPGFEIHPEPWLHMALWRVRLLFSYAAFLEVAPKLSVLAWGLIWMEAGDEFDYLLRYGQDYLPFVDTNVIKSLGFLYFLYRNHKINGKFPKQLA
jgi:hypothetical protein